MKTNDTSLYSKCISQGLKTDHYESDLYIEHSSKAAKLVNQYTQNSILFIDNIDNKLWIEVPFAYTPFYENKNLGTI